MPFPRVDNSKALLLLAGSPLAAGLTVIVNRLVIKPYPEGSWGSWLCVAWAATMVLIAIQFAIGLTVHSKRVGSEFLTLGLNAIVNAVVFLYEVMLILPEPPVPTTQGFLLMHFEDNIRQIYACTFALAFLPFIIARRAFDDKFKSVPQGARLLWMACAIVGFFVPAIYLRVHEILWLIGIPLVIALLIIYAKPFRPLPEEVQPPAKKRKLRFPEPHLRH